MRNAAYTKPEDDSLRILTGLLGESFVQNPMTSVGLPGTLIGKILGLINAAIFAVGVAYAAWLGIGLVARSASDGTPLGQGIDTVWTPIRTGVGIIGLLPVFGGFSLFQATAVGAVVLGVGLGNMTQNLLVSETATFDDLTPSSAMAASEPTTTSELKTAVRAALASELCLRAMRVYGEKMDGGTSVDAANVASLKHTLYDGPNGHGIAYGTKGQCGVLTVAKRGSDFATRASTGLAATLGFRSPSVDYEGIRQATYVATAAQIESIAERVAEMIGNPAEATLRGDDGYPDFDNVPAALDQIEAWARSEAANSLKMLVAEGQLSGLTTEAKADMSSGGWLRAGAYYAVYAEVSSAIADAQKSYAVRYVPGPYLRRMSETATAKLPGELQRIVYGLEALQPTVDKPLIDKLTAAATAGLAPQDDIVGAMSIGQASTKSSMQTAAATPAKDVSFGQAIVMKLAKRTVGDSGGAGLVNPVVSAKNLGDWLMTAGETGLVLSYAAEKSTVVGTAVKGVSKAASMLTGGKDLVGDLGPMLTPLFWSMIAIGLFMSVYLPMSIFLVWTSGVLVWLTGVVESVVYAQLAALSHVRAEGQGYVQPGTPAHRFYLYLLNGLLRPAFMIVGFVLAGALMTYAGSWLIGAWAAAMSSAQGNSNTGLLSIVAYLLLFCVTLWGLISSCSALIIDLPDRLLNWLGGHGESHKGAAILGASAGAVLKGVKGPVGGATSAASTITDVAKPTAKI